MTHEIYLIGGPHEGKEIAYDSLPPEIHFPYVGRCTTWVEHPYHKFSVPLAEKIVYRRLGDTSNYICITWRGVE